MSRVVRMIALDDCVGDVRRLRDCLGALKGVRVSLQRVSGSNDAAERLPRMRAEVLFVDEDLDRVTGVETIRALRSAGEMRPIIAMSRVDCGYLAADLIHAGADAYLAKRDLKAEMVGRVIDRAKHAARSRTAQDRLRRSAVRHLFAGRGASVARLA